MEALIHAGCSQLVALEGEKFFESGEVFLRKGEIYFVSVEKFLRKSTDPLFFCVLER